MFTMSSKSELSKRLPVFVFPEELNFFKGDENALKQILTLYNPYDVSLNFKILSNAPLRYRVVESEGVMKSHCCVDIAIRCIDTSKKSHEIREDKFRVEFFQGTKLIGRKHVPVNLVDKRPKNDEEGSESKEFKDLPPVALKSQTHTAKDSSSSPGVLTALVGLVSLVVLLLPLENESSSWPGWIHVTVSMKLMASFVLGLVTMVILKS